MTKETEIIDYQTHGPEMLAVLMDVAQGCRDYDDWERENELADKVAEIIKKVTGKYPEIKDPNWKPPTPEEIEANCKALAPSPELLERAMKDKRLREEWSRRQFALESGISFP